MGEISQEQYDMLKDIPKDERSKFVATFERLEKDTAKDYRKYVAIALEKFKALNDIKEKDIIEIAFDAIWLDKEVSNLQVTENIRFTCKRKASSILEIVFSVCLLLGFKTELVAKLSGALIACFGLAMFTSVGLKATFDYSVWNAVGACLAISCLKEKHWEIDSVIK